MRQRLLHLPAHAALTALTGLLAAALPAQDAGSTFGHARTRALAELGRLPTPADVAVADIANYHRHRLPMPAAGATVALELRFGAMALDDAGRACLQVGYTTTDTVDRSELPPLDLALVIDTSGSMQASGKMDQVKRALRAFVRRLRAHDRVALIGYSSEATLLERCRALGDGRWLEDAIEGLQPGGSTNLHGGLMLGLREISAQKEHGRDLSRRVILLTDGIANRGVTDPEQILGDALAFTREGIDLSTIGLGSDLNTELLDRLSRGGGGLFHFVADGEDIDKVFVAEMQSLVAPVARQCRLRLQLPTGLELEHVFGHRAVPGEAGELLVDLPDLNRGATGVVLCRLRGHRRFLDGGTVRAVLEFREAGQDRPRQVAADARIEAHPRRGAGDEDDVLGDAALRDPEVRKNFTIAELAQAMHDMARDAADKRWAEADRVLRRAVTAARQRYPSGDDQDLARVREMAEGHLRTLQRYLDRFRDG